MLNLPASVRCFLRSKPADMRWSFDMLAAEARDVMREDPLSGHLFIFRNRRADRVKILFWDRDGYALWYKRLEKGVFSFPAGDELKREFTAAELLLFLEGFDVSKAKRRERYSRFSTDELR